MSRTLILFGVLLAAILGGGQAAMGQPPSVSVEGPVLGYVLDRVSGLRPILGSPGAATLGQPLLAAAEVGGAAAGHGWSGALAVLAPGQDVMIIRGAGSGTVTTALPVPPGPALMAVSPSGDAAAFYYSAQQRLIVIGGLPAAPEPLWSRDMSDVAGGIVAVAVADGGMAATASAGGSPASVWLVTPRDGCQFLYSAAPPVWMTFLAGEVSLVIVDRGNGRVTVIRDASTDARVSVLNTTGDTLQRAVGVSASPDNRRVFVATAEPAGVFVWREDEDQPEFLPCPCAPAAMEALAQRAVFRLTDAAGGPVWLLDAAGKEARLVFVPEQLPAARKDTRAPSPVRRGIER